MFAKKKLDNLVKELQLLVFSYRTQAFGPTEMQKDEAFAYVNSISIINKNFNTDYMDSSLWNMKIFDSNKVVYQNLPKKLPLRKGDEDIFSKR